MSNQIVELSVKPSDPEQGSEISQLVHRVLTEMEGVRIESHSESDTFIIALTANTTNDLVRVLVLEALQSQNLIAQFNTNAFADKDLSGEIMCAPNGPYLVQGIDHMIDSTGQPTDLRESNALCRCGASQSKPFCDGSHQGVSFDDAKSTDGAPDRLDSYQGKSIAIHDNRAVCAHAGVCTDKLPGVWRINQSPWINPEGGDVLQILDAINACPSGALSYSGVSHPGDSVAEPPQIRAIKNGPYAVVGLTLEGQTMGHGADPSKFTLCRCGASKNKPFCDGTHYQIEFVG